MVALANRAWVACFVACLCSFVLEACGPPPPAEVQGCQAFDHLSERKIGDFASQSTATQYQIFMCARLYVRPPMVEIDREFALQGEPAARFLAQKVAESSDERVVEAILKVFDEMSRLETYDVSSDIGLIELLRAKISAMTNVPRRRRCEQILGGIEQRGESDT